MELCQVAGVSRAGYYRFQARVQESEADMDLRSAIQQIALEWPSYGYRRVHRELMRRGWRVNHKRVLRRMRVDKLLCLLESTHFIGCNFGKPNWASRHSHASVGNRGP